MTDTVMIAYRPCFGMGPTRTLYFDPSHSLADIVARCDFLPPDFVKRGMIIIGEHEIFRRNWKRIRIKAGQAVALGYPPAGGGGSGKGGGKAVLGLVLAVATLLTAGLAMTFGLPALGIAGGSMAAKMLPPGPSLLTRRKNL